MKKLLFLLLILFGFTLSQAQFNGNYRFSGSLQGSEICLGPELASTYFNFDLQQDGEKITGSITSNIEGTFFNTLFTDEGKTKENNSVVIKGWVDPTDIVHLNFIFENPQNYLQMGFLDSNAILLSARLFNHPNEGKDRFFLGDFNISSGAIYALLEATPDREFVEHAVDNCHHLITAPNGLVRIWQQ